MIYRLTQSLTYRFAPIVRWYYNLFPDISIEKGTIIEPGAVIRCQNGGSIPLGETVASQKEQYF